ncbi:hypothetical protein L1887_53498 [Cichorium endivia]|nr:hypothetical protein L1887_53498 [Cichorium endivia]
MRNAALTRSRLVLRPPDQDSTGIAPNPKFMTRFGRVWAGARTQLASWARQHHWPRKRIPFFLCSFKFSYGGGSDKQSLTGPAKQSITLSLLRLARGLPPATPQSSDSLPILPDEVVESAHAVKGPASREDAHLEYLAAGALFQRWSFTLSILPQLDQTQSRALGAPHYPGLVSAHQCLLLYRTTLAPRRPLDLALQRPGLLRLSTLRVLSIRAGYGRQNGVGGAKLATSRTYTQARRSAVAERMHHL